MKTRLYSLVLGIGLAILAAGGDAPRLRLALVGDSTVTDYPAASMQRGWGQLLPEFLVPGTRTLNLAVGGRSTKTFRSEGRWARLLAAKPQYVLIQFGHNDSHAPDKPESVDAATGFPANLRLYVEEARAAGIVPILVTPPHRRVFLRDGSLDQVLAPYAEAMRAVARELQVPLIDLNAFTARDLLALGEQACEPLYVSPSDRSHYSEAGARRLAARVAAELRAQVPALAASIQPLRLRLEPTFENCSVYVEGPAPAPNELAIRYRAAGASAWLSAHPLCHSTNDPVPRGSLFALQPGTAYQVQCGDSRGQVLAEATVSTWSEAVPIARTVPLRSLVPPGGGGPAIVKTQGTPDGWIRYVGEPGFVLDGGNAATEALLLQDAAYVIVEDAVIRGGIRHGIGLARCQNIRIRNCDIAGYGRVGTQDFAKDGKFYDANGKHINLDAGICLDRSGNLAIERCFVHDPRSRANSWLYSHPAGPTALFVRATGGVVVRYNDFVGSHSHRWNDVIEAHGNGDPDGGFNQDADIYGNFLAGGNDDGIELDGGQCNVRCYGNRIESTLCGISTAANTRGPSFVMRNLVTNLGEEFGLYGSAVKNGGGWAYSRGLSFFYHNTFATRGNGIAAVGYGNGPQAGLFLGVSRNNLLAVTGEGLCDPHMPPGADYDYDLFASPLGTPGTRLLARPAEAHGRSADPGFVDPAAGDFRLRPGSAAAGAGTPIPGFADGPTPDLGALPLAQPDRSLPLRPLPLAAAAGQLEFDALGQVRKLVLRSLDPAAAQEFAIRQNTAADWFSVEPQSVRLPPGGTAELMVRFLPERAGGATALFGALLIARSDGLSLPVAVYGWREPAGLPPPVEAESCPGAADFASEALGGTAQGLALVFTPDRVTADGQPAALLFAPEIPTAGRYYLCLRVSCPVPTARHDSLLAAVNGGPARLVQVSGNEHYTWVICGGGLELRQGRNEIRLLPRELLHLDSIRLLANPRLPAP